MVNGLKPRFSIIFVLQSKRKIVAKCIYNVPEHTYVDFKNVNNLTYSSKI